MSVVGRLPFNTNWNNKLNCQAYSTLRLANPSKFRKGVLFDVALNGKHIHYARVMDVRKFYMDELNEFIAYLDTGYSLKECKGILTKMFPNVNWKVQPLNMVLLVKEDIEKQGELPMS